MFCSPAAQIDPAAQIELCRPVCDGVFRGLSASAAELGNTIPKPSKKGTKRSHSETDSESSDSGESSSSKHSRSSDSSTSTSASSGYSSEEQEFGGDDHVELLHTPQEGGSSSSALLLVEDAENEIEVDAELLDSACEFFESFDFECDLKVFDDDLSGSQ